MTFSEKKCHCCVLGGGCGAEQIVAGFRRGALDIRGADGGTHGLQVAASIMRSSAFRAGYS